MLTTFSDQSINWQKAAKELTIRFLVEQEYLGYWRGTFFEEWEGMVDVFSERLARFVLARLCLARKGLARS